MGIHDEITKMSCWEKALLCTIGVCALVSVLAVRTCDAVRDWCKGIDANKVAVMDLVGSDEYDQYIDNDELDTLTAEEGAHLVKLVRRLKVRQRA